MELEVQLMLCNFMFGSDGDMQWYLSQVKGTIEEDVTEGKSKSVVFVF